MDDDGTADPQASHEPGDSAGADDTTEPSAGPEKPKRNPVVVLLAAVVVLLVIIVVVLVVVVLRGSGNKASDTSAGTTKRTTSIESGGFTYLEPESMQTVKWGQTATLPDGMTVRASNPHLGKQTSPQDKLFVYDIEYTNPTDKVLSTREASYHALVAGAALVNCSQVTGPPDMLPPEGTLQPGQSVSGSVGAGCPTGTPDDARLVVQVAQHSMLAPAVEFVP